MVSRCDSYGIAMRLVAGTRPATTLAVFVGCYTGCFRRATLAVFVGRNAYAPTSAYCNDWTSGLLSSGLLLLSSGLLLLSSGLPDFCLLSSGLPDFCLLDFRTSVFRTSNKYFRPSIAFPSFAVMFAVMWRGNFRHISAVNVLIIRKKQRCGNCGNMFYISLGGVL